jgi:DNA-binding SARP family transcriptional activator
MYFRILGPLEVEEDGKPLPLGGPRQRSLLAILLLRANQVVSNDRLTDELWGEDAPPTASKAIQVYVSKLRKQVGEARLVTRPPGYVLLLDSSELDLTRFEQLVAKARQADPESAAGLLREALGLWRGAPLADLEYEAFAQTDIARLEELRLTALEERIDADLAGGGHREALGELESLVTAHPLRERLVGQLMLALYRSGRQAEALDVYQNARRVLVEEIGLEPNPELQRLEKAILTQDPGLDPPERADRPARAPAAPDRAILVAPTDSPNIDSLLAVAAPLASEPAHELIVARALEANEQDDLQQATADLRRRREELLEQGTAVRVAAFTSPQPGEDLVRLAMEQSVDLVLVDAVPEGLGEDLSRTRVGEILRASPADVAVLVADGSRAAFEPNRPVFVPFGAAQHDWAALELGSWLARASGAPLRLLGALSDSGRSDGRDASRLLADASLLVQQCAGVVAEPLLTAPGPEELLKAAEGAGVLVVGLSERWAREGLGPVRSRLASEASAPILFVRRGVRPSGLAPSNTRTRFTWSMAGSSSGS